MLRLQDTETIQYLMKHHYKVQLVGHPYHVTVQGLTKKLGFQVQSIK